MGRSTAAPDRVRAAGTRRQALELRAAGRTYQQIGEALGITAQGAHKAVMAAFAESKARTAEDADALRALELERLDEMLNGLWPAASSGDVAAVNAALRIGERRAKLCGLDAATKIAGHDGGPVVPKPTWCDLARDLADDDLAALTEIAARTAASKGDPR